MKVINVASVPDGPPVMQKISTGWIIKHLTTAMEKFGLILTIRQR